MAEFEIRRDLNVDDLAELSPAEAFEAEEQGYLAGNKSYRDLRGFGWEDVRRALELERAVVGRIEAADDPAVAESDFDELRLEALDPIEELCGLDVGVASAVLASLGAWRRSPSQAATAGASEVHTRRNIPMLRSICRRTAPRGCLIWLNQLTSACVSTKTVSPRFMVERFTISSVLQRWRRLRERERHRQFSWSLRPAV